MDILIFIGWLWLGLFLLMIALNVISTVVAVVGGVVIAAVKWIKQAI